MARFNPSQVGYKRAEPKPAAAESKCFNPSQVGYKRLPRTPRLKGKGQFQSLTGRLQTLAYRGFELPLSCFNPSQVGYKRLVACWRCTKRSSFNPSQVGYKLIQFSEGTPTELRFNPSQVGYKLAPQLAYPAQHERVSIPHR